MLRLERAHEHERVRDQIASRHNVAQRRRHVDLKHDAARDGLTERLRLETKRQSRRQINADARAQTELVNGHRGKQTRTALRCLRTR